MFNLCLLYLTLSVPKASRYGTIKILPYCTSLVDDGKHGHFLARGILVAHVVGTRGVSRIFLGIEKSLHAHKLLAKV